MPSAGRIERLEILNFKSFKCHQIVGPFKDFAAIVDSNCAGRTDLEDAISFVLGVRSFSTTEPRGRIAFVKLVFSTVSGEDIKFGRAITSSGTSEYRINNIPVTWEIYSNTMKSLGIGEVDFEKETTPPPLLAPEEVKKTRHELEAKQAQKSKMKTKQETTDLMVSKSTETGTSASLDKPEATAIDKWKTTNQPSFRSFAAPVSLIEEVDSSVDGTPSKSRLKIKDVVGKEKDVVGNKQSLFRSLPRNQTLAQESSLQRTRSLRNTRTSPDTPLQWFEDDDDWSDIDPEKDSLGKAEDLADKLLRDAMTLHKRLASEPDVVAVSRFYSKAQHLMAETKETCGAIMYTNQDPDPESRPHSFSQTSQCSDAPEDDSELLKLRGSNARKQTKIDSLQKWRAYYKSELEARLAKLQDLETQHAKELQEKEEAFHKMEKAHREELVRRDAKRDSMEAKLREQIQELHLVVEELSGQLYDMEEHLTMQGIPYKPSSVNDPSSKMLLSAVISVKEAAHTFSRTFMSHLKQHLAKAHDLDEQICLESEVIVARPSDYKFLVQSFICRRMFLDFDSECFNIESCMTEIFDVEEHARACFQEYLTYRSVADTVTLLTDNRQHSNFLREFCFKKFLHIVSESTEEAFFADFNHSDDICGGRHPASRFYESYCKLAVSVWLLHRLAFSFQPPARMISVRKGSRFDPAYMESSVPGIADGDGVAALPFEALVGLMVHPGFRVGNSIIPAQVYLVTA